MISGFVPDKQFIARLQGSSLVTAKIFYRMPDYRSILQEFIWQDLDLVPKYPNLAKFLDFWDRELDGPIHVVEVAHVGLLSPADIRSMGAEFHLN
jgi:uncharacterized protein Usg